MHSRHDLTLVKPLPVASLVRLRLRASRLVALALCAPMFGVRLLAQQRDTTPARIPTASPQAVMAMKPPISPARAFFYSLALPGSAQSILGRHKTAAGLLIVESVSLVMLRESALEVRAARLAATDTIIATYVDSRGATLGSPTRRVGLFSDAEVRSRRAHLEDWIAFIVANHFYGASDAFVSAHLWDVPMQVGLSGGHVVMSASVRW